MRRLLLYIFFLISTTAPLLAQTVHVSAPRHVSVGQEFRLEYSVNNQNVDELQPGNLPSGLEVVFGPSQSRSSSYQFVNGHAISSSSVSVSYILVATRRGTFNIGGARAIVNGRRVSAPGVRITASGASNVSVRHMGRRQMQEEMEMEEPEEDSRGELFIRATANRHKVYEQEPILLTYKVYTTMSLTQLEGKMPELTGFHSQEVKLPQQKTYHIETLNGRRYKTVVCGQYLVYPQMTGNLKIPAITYRGVVVERQRNIDPIDAFFNGESDGAEVQRNIVAPAVTIQVLPLPKKPAGFSGGVGHFNISAQLDKHEQNAGQSINLRVVVGGMGNLKLIKQPQVQFPASFDHYDPKVTDKTRITANGLEGNVVYDFLVVPRQEGNYTIPPIKFTYYDTSSHSYRTISTKAMTVKVLKGDGSESDDLQVTQNEDIRPIHQGQDDTAADTDGFFFGSAAYCVLIILLFAAFVTLFIVFRKRAMELADVEMARGRKANKIAARRLRSANLLMLKGDRAGFYDEVLHAMWGYAGDKLHIPSGQLNRDNIAERLGSLGISDEIVKKFVDVISVCEYERYAPDTEAGDMDYTQEKAMTAIMEIENALKGTKHGGAKAGNVVMLVALLLLPLAASAVTKQNADTEYQHGNYQQAVRDYEELVKSKPSADLYYNLGNAYYRCDNIPKAVLNYERALRLAPGSRDVRWNLEVARSKTIDKIEPEPEFFIVRWWRGLVYSISIDGWAMVSIVSITLALILALAYLFCFEIWKRKVGFFGGLFFLLLFILANVCGWKQKRTVENMKAAVVMSPSVTVRDTPSADGRAAFVLHEGTKVEITDDGMKDWSAVHVADGREGWVPIKYLEKI